MTEELRKNVTMVTIIGSPVYFKSTIKAAHFCQQQIGFENVKVFTCFDFPVKLYSNFQSIKIPEFTKDDYNEFVFSHLYKFINTEYILLIHDDGFIINPSSWTNDFLNYDYIGALWTDEFIQSYGYFDEKYRCGCGGFSLRSKSMLYNCSKLKYRKDAAEDCLIGLRYKDKLLSYGMRFPEPNVAVQFSIGNTNIPELLHRDGIKMTHEKRETLTSFGFHWKQSDALKYLNNTLLF